MPTRLCQEPRCPNTVAYRGRCQAHARDRERQTHKNRTVYNSKRWRMTRKRVLFEQPLCPCGAIATDVDHITPIEQGGDRWAHTNLQALCAPCHSRKTKREQGVTPMIENERDDAHVEQHGDGDVNITVEQGEDNQNDGEGEGQGE